MKERLKKATKNKKMEGWTLGKGLGMGLIALAIMGMFIASLGFIKDVYFDTPYCEKLERFPIPEVPKPELEDETSLFDINETLTIENKT